MPLFNANREWENLINAEHAGVLTVPARTKDRVNRLDQWAENLKIDAALRNGSYEEEVMRQDVAMWYGALMSDGISNVVRRVFATLYYGGMYVYRNGNYQTWRSLGAPIATALSHGGRVTIQLPPISDSAGCRENEFWNWLWPAPQARAAATHALSQRSHALHLPDGRVLKIEEHRGKTAAVRSTLDRRKHHYGMNVALGRAGYRNPWTGQMIQADGRHGHLYFLHYASTDKECGGLLIGCEGSGPPDRMRGLTDKMDQTGHTHDLNGSSSKFSPTGGPKFKRAEGKEVVKKRKIFPDKTRKFYWHSCGPTSEENGIVVDLAHIRNQESMASFVMRMEPYFISDSLGWPGSMDERH
jgi:hypothetical protein